MNALRRRETRADASIRLVAPQRALSRVSGGASKENSSVQPMRRTDVREPPTRGRSLRGEHPAHRAARDLCGEERDALAGERAPPLAARIGSLESLRRASELLAQRADPPVER